MKEVMMTIGLAGGPVRPPLAELARRRTKPQCTRQLPRSASAKWSPPRREVIVTKLTARLPLQTQSSL